jgi:Fic family protein
LKLANVAPIGYRHVRCFWLPRSGSATAREAGFAYHAYVPDLLAGVWRPPRSAASLAAGAERACRKFERSWRARVAPDLGRHLATVEALASSRIENIVASSARVAAARAGLAGGDTDAEWVGRCVHSLLLALELASRAPLTVDDLCSVHRVLFAPGPAAEVAGSLRDRQTWFGGGSSSPRHAEFIPPPPAEVLPLLDDLLAFCADERIPAVAQAAAAHVQFETIHPFLDGNGRVGRILIHALLHRRGVTGFFVPPLSLAFLRSREQYLSGLTSFRFGGEKAWLRTFAESLERAAAIAAQLAVRLSDLVERWQAQAGRPAPGSVEARLLQALASGLVVDDVGLPAGAAPTALRRLERAGVVRPAVHAGRRAYEGVGLFPLLDEIVAA